MTYLRENSKCNSDYENKKHFSGTFRSHQVILLLLFYAIDAHTKDIGLKKFDYRWYTNRRKVLISD